MATKSLEIHPSALAELKSSISWYLEQNEATADKFVEEIDRAIDLVLASPRRWPTGDLDTRKFVLRLFPFAVIYHEGNQRSESWPSPTDTGSLDIGKTVSNSLTKSLGPAALPNCSLSQSAQQLGDSDRRYSGRYVISLRQIVERRTSSIERGPGTTCRGTCDKSGFPRHGRKMEFHLCAAWPQNRQ